jgi:hypothetical protein
MLSDSYRQAYLAFQQVLQQMEDHLQQGDPTTIRQSIQTAQALLQQILALDVATLTATEAIKVQSLQTEINKQLRLLSTDLMFLQTARLAETIAQRQQQMGDRLTILQRYCEAILT